MDTVLLQWAVSTSPDPYSSSGYPTGTELTMSVTYVVQHAEVVVSPKHTTKATSSSVSPTQCLSSPKFSAKPITPSLVPPLPSSSTMAPPISALGTSSNPNFASKKIETFISGLLCFWNQFLIMGLLILTLKFVPFDELPDGQERLNPVLFSATLSKGHATKPPVSYILHFHHVFLFFSILVTVPCICLCLSENVSVVKLCS